MAEILDISRRLHPRMPVWPGDAPFRLDWTSRLTGGASANVGAVSFSTHVGTHADAPLHVLDDAADVVSLPLDAFWGRARVIDVPGRAVDGALLAKLDWQGVERVLFITGGSGWLTDDGAGFLVLRQVRLIGIDSMSIDAPESARLSVHLALARAGIALLEGLDLSLAAPGDYELVALPLAIAGGDASPVRAVLRVLG